MAKLEEEVKNPDLLDLKQYQIPEDNRDHRTLDYILSLSTASSLSNLIPLPYLLQPVVKDEHPSLPPQRIEPGSKVSETNLNQEATAIPRNRRKSFLLYQALFQSTQKMASQSFLTLLQLSKHITKVLRKP